MIITESGRASVASSSILIFNILDTTIFETKNCPKAGKKDHIYLSYMRQILSYLDESRIQECFNDLNYYRNELRSLFRNNQINLIEMAKIEKTYLYVLSKIKSISENSDKRSTNVVKEIHKLTDIYHCKLFYLSKFA